MLTRALDDADVAFAAGDLLGETPFWSGEEGALYWVDIRSRSVRRWIEAMGEHTRWTMPEICTGIVPTTGGRLVVALRSTIYLLDPTTGNLQHLARIEADELGNRLNEMRCDPAGRLWIGSMRDYGAAVSGSLYCVGPDLSAVPILTDIRVPNGLAWSPDGRVMYFADTAEDFIRRYAYDVETGSLGGGMTEIGRSLAGGADGSAMDAEGYLWNARYGGGMVVRIAPDGRVVETVTLPVSQPAACAFGGADLKTLFITTARQRLDEAALKDQPLAGHVFRLHTQVPGLPESAFALPDGRP
ncbi:MAG: SMP-30/gluconolactonase/LRE family protein [Rhizobium sp.]|nr:MAG: SMP-30/gluconolactonase/LRE family protein [Rhizobium sp.]